MGQLLGLPHHGVTGLSVHLVLRRHHSSLLQVSQGSAAEVRHHHPASLALLDSHCPGTVGLHRLREWMARRRIRSPALDYSGHAAHMGGCERCRKFQRRPDILSVPLPIHPDAMRGNQHPAQADQTWTRIHGQFFSKLKSLNSKLCFHTISYSTIGGS